MEPNTWVDATNLACPLPIVHLARAIKDLPRGTLVGLWATDSGVTADLPAWCASTGHRLVSLEQENGRWRGIVERR